MCDCDAAYAAGFVDGEGHITIRRKTLRAGRRMPEIRIEVIVRNTKRAPLDWLVERYGGSVKHVKLVSEKWNDSYEWSVSAQKALTFLRAIRPFLLIKQPQADLAIEYQIKMGEWGGARYIKGAKGTQYLSPDALLERDGYVERMKALNVRGRQKPE